MKGRTPGRQLINLLVSIDSHMFPLCQHLQVEEEEDAESEENVKSTSTSSATTGLFYFVGTFEIINTLIIPGTKYSWGLLINHAQQRRIISHNRTFSTFFYY